MATTGLPDFFIAGVPKAGTTALHSALANHPELLLSTVKEPKFFMCDGRRPAPQRGPGDAHSAQEWVWRRSDYERLFADDRGRLRGESTPFYLYDLAAQERIAEAVPGAKFVIVLRDPVDRAYSNWLHLWSDGLEPLARFEDAWEAEEQRVAAGWAPFWHYQRLGRYGEQLEHLLGLFPAEQVHVLRYRELVDTPGRALDGICAFLGVRAGLVSTAPPENSRGFVVDSSRTRALAKLVRVGAQAGALAPPQVWRAASRPLLRVLQSGAASRPRLDVEVRRRLVEAYRDDLDRLRRLTATDYSDWLDDRGRGAFADRRADDSVGSEPG